MDALSLPEDFERRLHGADVNLDSAKQFNSPFAFGEYMDDLDRLSKGSDPNLQHLYPNWQPDHFRQLIDVILQKLEAREMIAERDRLANEEAGMVVA